MSFIRSLRRVLWSLDTRLSRHDKFVDEPVAEPPPDRYQEIKDFVWSIDLPTDEAREYLRHHLHRIARTLTLVPKPFATRRVLELGAYMQMTPALQCVLGYEEVRGAYYGELGRTDEKRLTAGGREVFRCLVDHFDAEKDIYPYPEGQYDAVLACEIFEHLLHDPMHMLLEIRRVLVDGGKLILTTPNCASYSTVANILLCIGHPQLHAMYANPLRPDAEKDIPHVREYTPQELAEVVKCAGFEVEYLFTEKIEGYNSDLFIKAVLQRNGYSTALRGEQTYVVARKVADAQITRYPFWLYEGFV
jgi:SAM-dependent methyltransferase